MINKENNFAYIDAANLHKGVQNLHWQLDYHRFRVWLKEKYGVTQAYLFIGLVPKYKDLYTHLQEVGYTLVFKDVTYDGSGKVKGNCDAELVLRATRDAFESAHHKAVIVSSDGDYAGLVNFLQERGKLLTIISPAVAEKCSILLKRTGAKIAYVSAQKEILDTKKERTPDTDRTV